MTDRQELEALSSQELHDRAVRRAVHHLDIGFLWQLLREIPEGEAVAGHIDETAADVTQLSAMIDDAFGHESPTSPTRCARSTWTTWKSTTANPPRSARRSGPVPTAR